MNKEENTSTQDFFVPEGPAVTRAKTQDLSDDLLEGVCDSLVNLVHLRASGVDNRSRVLWGAKPSSLILSSFLLPFKNIDDGDEVTSPIYISSQGMYVQTDKRVKAKAKIHINLSLYVRVMPTWEDLVAHPELQPYFPFNSELESCIRLKRKRKNKELYEKFIKPAKEKNIKPDLEQYNQEKLDALKKILDEEGVPVMPKVVPAQRGFTSQSGDCRDEEKMELGTQYNEAVRAQMIASSDKYKPQNMPKKWMRLDVHVPEVEVNLNDFENPQVTEQLIKDQIISAVQHKLLEWQDDPDPEWGGKFNGYRSVKFTLKDYADYDAWLSSVRASSAPIVLPQIEVALKVSPTFNPLTPNFATWVLQLENVSPIPSRKTAAYHEIEPAVFGVELKIDLPKKAHIPYTLGRAKSSYRFRQYMHYPAQGYNCGISTEQVSDPDILRICTTWQPRYHQPRIKPKSHHGVESGVQALSKHDCIDGLKPLVNAFNTWIKEQEHTVDPTVGLESNSFDAEMERAEFQNHLSQWREEAKSIEAGVSILEESQKAWVQAGSHRGEQSNEKAIVFEAWLCLNEAMTESMRKKLGLPADKVQWRLFQLAFILASIPSFATRLECFKEHYNERRDNAVTLLYFATGGGKSEAFFGLLLFNLFFDRLRGKRNGVTALMRYPLRLLTVQQAQRALSVMAEGELVRRKHRIGGKPFALGLWQGRGSTPNRHSDADYQKVPEFKVPFKEEDYQEGKVDGFGEYPAVKERWHKFPTCPFCEGKTALRRHKATGFTLGHFCLDESKKCYWNRLTNIAPLPVLICDEDIYDFAPAVVLGTVDKLAMIGHSSDTILRILGMLGISAYQHKTTGRLVSAHRTKRQPNAKTRFIPIGENEDQLERLWPIFKDGKEYFFDPFPSLLIQDEAHLLDESLGTFASIFETLYETALDRLAPAYGNKISCAPDGKRRKAKVIAASATVDDPENQLQNLYQRAIPATQFPHPGSDLYHSFYAEPAEPKDPRRQALDLDEVETRNQRARFYVAMLTNGKTHTSASTELLAHFHLAITELFEGFESADPTRHAHCREILKTCVSGGPLEAIYCDALEAASISQLATIIDLHRIAITYVTNKRGGDMLMASEGAVSKKMHTAHGFELKGFETRLISGGVSQKEVEEAVRFAETRPKAGERFKPLEDELRSIVATSAISHGVDCSAFNSMIFLGLLSAIDEYIQASSRVGRTFVGFSLLVPTPQRRRDRYVVSVFDVFHRFLERMIQPAAIDRFADKAMKRSFPSIVNLYLCGVVPLTRLIALDDSKKNNWRGNRVIRPHYESYDRNRPDYLDGFCKFTEECLGLVDDFAPTNTDYYKTMIKNLCQDIINQLMHEDMRDSNVTDFFGSGNLRFGQPMTSLRDVDEPGEIFLGRGASTLHGETGRHSLHKEDELKALYRLIRGGNFQ
ncbi:TPA: helicase C-terminal domain-containing protein [Vibrio parahaemolyticus]